MAPLYTSAQLLKKGPFWIESCSKGFLHDFGPKRQALFCSTSKLELLQNKVLHSICLAFGTPPQIGRNPYHARARVIGISAYLGGGAEG